MTSNLECFPLGIWRLHLTPALLWFVKRESKAFRGNFDSTLLHFTFGNWIFHHVLFIYSPFSGSGNETSEKMGEYSPHRDRTRRSISSVRHGNVCYLVCRELQIKPTELLLKSIWPTCIFSPHFITRSFSRKCKNLLIFAEYSSVVTEWRRQAAAASQLIAAELLPNTTQTNDKTRASNESSRWFCNHEGCPY